MENKTPDKLYTAYSYVNDHKDLGNVCFEWVYHLREKPVAPYQEMIVDYTNLDEEGKEPARNRVNEMFTSSEADLLCDYLEDKHGFDSFIIEKPLPIRPEDMEDERVHPKSAWVPGSIYMFSSEETYNLPFDVWAYYDLRKDNITNPEELITVIESARARISVFAREYFFNFEQLSSGLKFNILDCGCIYYQQRLLNGSFSSHVNVLRDKTERPCLVCNGFDKAWKIRVIDTETVINLSGFQIEMD